MHVAVDIKTKKIISMNVTKENVHDGKILKRLVDDASSKNNNIQKVLADEHIILRKILHILRD